MADKIDDRELLRKARENIKADFKAGKIPSWRYAREMQEANDFERNLIKE